MENTSIGDDDKSALLDICVWLFLVLAILAVIAQTATKLVIRRHLGLEDYLILLSLIFAAGQSASVRVQIANGLGQHINTLDSKEQQALFKAEYAGNLLFTLCLCATKLSLVVFVKSLAVVKWHRYAAYGLTLATLLWAISSMLVIAFQCYLPHAWDYRDNNVCIDRKAFWHFYGVANILTDLGPVVMMLIVALRIRTSVGRKLTVAGVFASRIVVIAAACCKLHFINRESLSRDPTFDLWPVWICTQLIQTLAIITACIPYLKPFMDSLESGGLRADQQYRRGTTYGYYDRTIGSRSARNDCNAGNKSIIAPLRDDHDHGMTSRESRLGSPTSWQWKHRESARELQVMSSLAPGNGTTVVGGAGNSSDWEDVCDGDDANSQSSQARIIKETRTVTVRVASRDDPNRTSTHT